jgi:hypothetical protein
LCQGSTITAVPRRSVRVRAASQVSKVSVADTLTCPAFSDG